MELIGVFQVFIIVIIIIITMTLLHLCCRLTYSCWVSPVLAHRELKKSGLDGPSPSFQVMDMNSSAAAFAIPPPQENYDVFLCFRGEDTRYTFTSHLYAALCAKKIETYIDYRLERGEEMKPALLEAIEKSKLSVIIFSNYASSTWCLDELLHILECKERYGQFVVPIFYDIEPSHVRKQQGTYADAFAQLEELNKDSIHKVLNWRDALTKAANLSGFDNSNKTGGEADLVEKVVQDIWTKLIRESSSSLEGLVGVENCIEKIESLLCIDSLDVCTVGIWGMGGSGKTTLADAVYHRISSKFEASCFLANVREKSTQKDGLIRLRNTLLSEILKEKNLNIGTPSIGSDLVRKRLRCTKVLVVLDDVNDSMQLELLAGDPISFGPGSRIIVTTRDRRLLKKKVDDDKIYKLKELNWDDAVQLFHLHAFKNDTPRTDYAELSRMVVDSAKGNPLALKILGSLFHHCERKEEWEDEVNKLKKFPNEEIQNVLRISYNGLEKNAKEIFLDIACFYKGMDVDFAKRMLLIRGFFARGIGVLIDKSLISLSTTNCLEMHDLVQEMGWEIVCQQCIEEPGKRNRLFAPEDVYRVLKNNSGTETVECIFFNMSNIKELRLNRAAFKKMYNLKVLKIDNSSFDKKCSKLYLSLPSALSYLHWEGYPLKSLPSKFSPHDLVELRMPNSQVERLWDNGQNLVNLKLIDLTFCKHLTQVPDLSNSRKIEHIDLRSCKSLVEIPSYFQYLDKLTHLQLGGCSNLKYLPEMPDNIQILELYITAIKELPSSVWSHKRISKLCIEFCSGLKNLPSTSCKLKLDVALSLRGCISLGKLSELPRDITVLDLRGTPIESLPSSIGCLFGLVDIELKNCKRFVSLPTSFCKLKSLKRLDLSGCSQFEYFPEILEPMENLEFLSLERTAVKVLPSSIHCLFGLIRINLNDCKKLVSLPPSLCKLKHLQRLDLSGCSEFEHFPEIMEPMKHPRNLTLKGTAVKELPSSIQCLFDLVTINLNDCEKLVSLPPSICHLKCLQSLDLSGCSEFEHFPEIMEPMKHLHNLNLKGTAVKELPSSIQCLLGLVTINLNDCKKLVSLPPSICKLKCLQSLDLSGCPEFEHFPEIMEPMEHLGFLALQGTSVKELPGSIGNLTRLQLLNLCMCKNLEFVPNRIYNLNRLKPRFPFSTGLCLNLSYSGILEIPDLLCSTTIRDLDLSGTRIESIPASIKQASGLYSLRLNDCKNLQSLPELPLMLRSVEAHACTSLKTVSSSRTPRTQAGYNCRSFRDSMLHIFSNCLKLDQNAWGNIMAAAQLRILQRATESSQCRQRNHRCFRRRSSVTVVCSGNEIPNWFSHRNEGSSINIKLPPNWFRADFLGFALSFVVAFKNYNVELLCFKFGCKSNFKTNASETHEFYCELSGHMQPQNNNGDSNDYHLNSVYCELSGHMQPQNTNGGFHDYNLNSDHVFVWYNAFDLVWGSKCSTAFRNGVSEAFIDFYPIDHPDRVKVEKCGICLLYAQDAEKFKFDVCKFKYTLSPKVSNRDKILYEDWSLLSQIRAKHGLNPLRA